MIKTLNTAEQLEKDINALIQLEPRFQALYEQTGLPTLRLRQRGFEELYQAIVSQQLSVAAARSIWEKLGNAGLHSQSAVLQSTDEQLRANGLSKQKTRYVRSLATHQIDYAALEQLDDEAVIATLTQVTGIGRWTAEIYCLFSLNRHDIFAANDLALQVASQDFLSLDKRPTEAVMRKIAKDWQPYRSAAAYLLWAYYSVIKQRDAVL